ncbi:MAG: THUMP domain-containing protein [Candidatus Bathyarchaeota archaeon]|nr:THUMP domain-containing protein [Candidatus Bathyarchaeota archaeon]MDH5779133.1 THUMP domain-containing protein [Candidatus Bathyarchaeota archaeon]
MYEFNLLVSCSWANYGKAKVEIIHILKRLDDKKPYVRRTIARGIIGVKTSLDSREVVRCLREICSQDPLVIQHTFKWVPVDLWTASDIESMKEGVKQLKNRIQKGEKWRITIEKRRYIQHHKMEIIRELAEIINEKVDLENPDRILRIDIIGKYAGISLLESEEIFSISKL